MYHCVVDIGYGVESSTDYRENVVDALFALSNHRQIDHRSQVVSAWRCHVNAYTELPLKTVRFEGNLGRNVLRGPLLGHNWLPCLRCLANRTLLAVSDGA